MQITLRYFAILRDRMGGEAEADLTVPDGVTVADIESQMIAADPSLRDLLARAAFAVNREYVPRSTELHDGDELAIIPPVSGG